MNANKMKANTREKYGSIDIIDFKEINQHLPEEDELLIKLKQRLFI